MRSVSLTFVAAKAQGRDLRPARAANESRLLLLLRVRVDQSESQKVCIMNHRTHQRRKLRLDDRSDRPRYFTPIFFFRLQLIYLESLFIAGEVPLNWTIMTNEFFFFQ